MSKGPAIAAIDHADVGSVQIASSAVVIGTVHLGERALVAEGAVIRSSGTGVEIGTGSAVLENSVVVGNAERPNDGRSAHHVRAPMPGRRGDGRRPLRDRERLHPHARRPRR